MIKHGTKKPEHKLSFSPTQYVFFSFLLAILIGAVLLYLPISQSNPENKTRFIDTLFTATSATCVTGQAVVTTASHWTLFGQIVILLLIQIGGFTFISLYMLVIIYLGKKVTLTDRLQIQSAFNQSGTRGMVRLVLMVVRGAFLIEGIGAVALFFGFYSSGKVSLGRSVYYGIFHSVSAFCNAGFDVIGENSLAPFVDSFPINITIMLLIITGGIGFIVWRDILDAIKKYAKDKKNKLPHKRHRFSLHTKLALSTTAILILLGSIIVFSVEHSNPETLGSLPLSQKILASFFQSVTLRTAGYTTISHSGLKSYTVFMGSLFMLVGGSPGGTAGGIKTVTIAVIVGGIYSVIKGRNNIVIGKRRIGNRSFLKAVSITALMFLLLLIGVAILMVTERNSVFPHDFLDLMYEISSVLGTVGLTTGITPFLSGLGKVLLITCMIIGRLGPITVITSLNVRHVNNATAVDYPLEDILIG